MNSVPPAGSAGLCADCRCARIIRSRRGSEFLLCERSRTDARFARYPVLPVRRCTGHEPDRGPSAGTTGRDRNRARRP